MRRIEVKAEWDSDATVWVATSDDLPGLVTEAETVEALQLKLAIMIPDLLQANGNLGEDISEIPWSFNAHREATISIRD